MKRTLKRELKALEIAEGEAVGTGGPAGQGAPAPRVRAKGSGRGPSGPRPASVRLIRDGPFPPIRRAGAGPFRGEEPPGRRVGATPSTDPASDSSGGAEAKWMRAFRGEGRGPRSGDSSGTAEGRAERGRRARGPRTVRASRLRRRGPDRPVLKHGPRSLTRTRVSGRGNLGAQRKQRGARAPWGGKGGPRPTPHRRPIPSLPRRIRARACPWGPERR